MRAAVQAALHPGRFIDTEFDPDVAAEYLNKYLQSDGYLAERRGRKFHILQHGEAIVELPEELAVVEPITREFMNEQIAKCRKKLEEDDFDGAITNARSLLEAVLLDIERRTGGETSYDGDLNKLYKRVRKTMNLDPKGAHEVVQPILTGFTSVVSGLAGTRNKMSDAHVRSFRPSRHHAKLAVNAANTLVDFLIDSYQHQVAKGLLPADS